jgi:hypothetical protein
MRCMITNSYSAKPETVRRRKDAEEEYQTLSFLGAHSKEPHR